MNLKEGVPVLTRTGDYSVSSAHVWVGGSGEGRQCAKVLKCLKDLVESCEGETTWSQT